MKIKELYQQLVPRARTPVTWRRALPLIFFLLLYAGLCVGLELSGVLLFARPWAFVLILFAVWVWWLSVAGYGGLSRGRALAALLTRLVRHNRKLGGWRKALWSLFSGLTTMMSRPRFNELAIRLMAARGERPPES